MRESNTIYSGVPPNALTSPKTNSSSPLSSRAKISTQNPQIQTEADINNAKMALEGKKGGLSGSLGVGQVTAQALPQILPEINKEVIKKEVTSQVEAEKKLDQLVAKAEKIIFKASAFFPLDLFPDEIVIDTEKVDIINRQFFMVKQIHSVKLSNIAEVSVETSVFFATIHLVEKAVQDYQMSTIGYLKKKDAYEAKQIIQGLISATEENIELTKFDIDDLREKLKKVGSTSDITRKSKT